MKELLRKTTLSVLIGFIAVSFSGCLGIPLPGQGTSDKKEQTAPERNDSQGVFKSVDGGATWEHKVTIENSESFLDQVVISSMAMDPQNNQVLFLGTAGGGLYKTENGADSWFKVTDENGKMRDASSIYDIAIEEGNSDIIYLATLNDNRGVLLKSDDGGKSWSEQYISTELGKAVNRVQIDPIRKNIVYIGTEQGGFIKSEDRGYSWIEVKWFPNAVRNFVIDFNNTNGIILLTADKIFKTTDGGANEETSWEELNKTIITSLNFKIGFDAVNSITIDNDNPLIVYMTYKNLVLVTRDGGYAWGKLDTITPSLTPLNAAPQIKQIGMIDSSIYYGAGNALYKSANKGYSWSSFDIPILGDVRYTVSDHTDPNIIYVGSYYVKPKK
ncbi:MAG: hypothetical protein PHI66_01425 [Candidatus Pacebacteria bacterium]|nr:hypothetical protein [Candidatus Paceibacterota bacterium]